MGLRVGAARWKMPSIPMVWLQRVDASKDSHSENPNASVRKEEPKMRSLPFILAAFAFTAPAVAQSWEEYSYPDYAFTVTFPADPKIETTIHEVADGRSVPARVYSSPGQGRVQDDGR